MSPRAERPEIYVRRSVALASEAWQSFNANDAHWRTQYYGRLVQHPRASSIISLIELHDPLDGSSEDVGFAVVLPVASQLAEMHLSGTLDQYTFRSSWVADDCLAPVSYHYIQSIYVKPEFAHSYGAKKAISTALRSLLRAQHCGEEGADFCIYAEIGSKVGQALCQNHGLLRHPTLSYHGNPLYTLKSHLAQGSKADATVLAIRALYRGS